MQTGVNVCRSGTARIRRLETADRIIATVPLPQYLEKADRLIRRDGMYDEGRSVNRDEMLDNKWAVGAHVKGDRTVCGREQSGHVTTRCGTHGRRFF